MCDCFFMLCFFLSRFFFFGYSVGFRRNIRLFLFVRSLWIVCISAFLVIHEFWFIRVLPESVNELFFFFLFFNPLGFETYLMLSVRMRTAHSAGEVTVDLLMLHADGNSCIFVRFFSDDTERCYNRPLSEVQPWSFSVSRWTFQCFNVEWSVKGCDTKSQPR